MKTLIAAFALSLGVVATAQAQQPGAAPRTGREVLDRYVAAVGGKTLAERRSLYMRMKWISLAGDTVVSETWKERPNKFLSRLTKRGHPVVEGGFDGVRGWTKVGEKARLLTPEETQAIRQQAAWPDDLSIYSEVELIGVDKFESCVCYKVRLVAPGSPEQFRFFDASTGLSMGSQHTAAGPNGPVTVTILLLDYLDSRGVRVPTRVVQRVLQEEQGYQLDIIDWDRVPAGFIKAPAL